MRGDRHKLAAVNYITKQYNQMRTKDNRAVGSQVSRRVVMKENHVRLVFRRVGSGQPRGRSTKRDVAKSFAGTERYVEKGAMISVSKLK